MPETSAQRGGEDEHDPVVEGLAAGVWVHFLRIARARADDEMRVMACVDDDLADGFQVGNLLAQLEREVNQAPAPDIPGGMLLRVGIENRAARIHVRAHGQRRTRPASSFLPPSIHAMTLSSPSRRSGDGLFSPRIARCGFRWRACQRARARRPSSWKSRPCARLPSRKSDVNRLLHGLEK